jgi:4,5-DOPA dioxygenase extradiol
MNAIEHNQFTTKLKEMRNIFPNPRAILCISAHWMTEGTWITHMNHPKTIHDFYGFPPELFQINYPAPGSPEIAERVQKTIDHPAINFDDEIWGLDHGTWSILKHMYPKANIPVLQLSLSLDQAPSYHFELGKKLSNLRNEGILIIGSGNVVHNLRKIKWDNKAEPHEWAIEFDKWIKEKIIQQDYESLVNEFDSFEAGKLSVPTLEHYLPLLYILGASDKADKLTFEFEGIQNGSISMRSLSFKNLI